LSAADHDAVEEAMRTTEVRHLAQRLIGSLSGGERQRTVIAAALAQGGRTLLLDEPTSFLDYRHQIQVLDLLDRLHREQEYTIVTVTHDLNSTLEIADRALALVDGRSVFFGDPAALLDDDRLESIYGCAFTMVDRAAAKMPIVVPERPRSSAGSR
jgi:iron complex transport system ATP-binding protein